MSEKIAVGATAGRIISIDSEIEFIENLVEQGKTKHMITIAVENTGVTGLDKVHTMTLGAPLKDVRDYLQVALSSVEDMIGEKAS